MVRTRHKTRQAGFLLMDAIVALAVLGIGVFTAMVFFRAQVRETRHIHQTFAAQLIAESEMERLRAMSYDAIPVGQNQTLDVALPSVRHFGEFAATRGVREIAPGLKAAEVRVEWVSPAGRTRFVTLTGEFSRELLQDARTTTHASASLHAD